MAIKLTAFQKTQIANQNLFAQASQARNALDFLSPRDGTLIATAVVDPGAASGFVLHIHGKLVSLETMEAMMKWAKKLAAKK